MKKNKVLFVCIHNSARSQMAEAFLNRACPSAFEAHSAGLEPGTLNPLVVDAMREVGFDISSHQTKSVAAIMRAGHDFGWVVTVCDDASAEKCPVFPGAVRRLHWGFPDPSAVQGNAEERMNTVRAIRDQIRAKIEDWCREVCLPAATRQGAGSRPAEPGTGVLFPAKD
jgi:arsenate reductase